MTACRQETERIQAQLPEHQGILEDLTQTYAPTAMALGQGDPPHPNANGTVADNLAEAGEQVTAARDLLNQSETAYGLARLLEAADLLRQVREGRQMAVHRLREIKEKQQRLQQTIAANDAVAPAA